ncbi:MAG: purine/pyrimidine permease [Candidatus Brocadiae bacterium]|nr:purine/pyrimidine permease [Candidatus Brocadiia bacterium]
MNYRLEDKPPLGLAILLGLQHVLTLFGATTLVPLLLGGQIFGDNPKEIATFIGNIYLGMGITTLLQIWRLTGSGLPIVQGSSFAFIAPIAAIAAMGKTAGLEGNGIMQMICGAIIAGGFLELIVGYSGLIGKIKKIITPVVMGPTIMLIGFGLADVAVSFNAAKSWPISLAVVAGIFVFALVLKTKIFNLFPVFLSILFVYIFCFLMTLQGFFPQGHPGYVRIADITQANWFAYPVPFRYGFPTFDIAAFFAILAAYLVSMIESLGDYHSISKASDVEKEGEPTTKTINKGIGAEGLGCIFCGIFGASASTSYSENIGLVGLTKVASRYVVMIAALILILMSFSMKLAAIIAAMPSPIIGGAYIALFGIIGALGIQILAKADLNSQRNVMIVGFTILMGLGVGSWMSGFAKDNPNLWGTTGFSKILWDIVVAVCSSKMAVGAICALVLDNMIPGSPQERGIKA